MLLPYLVAVIIDKLVPDRFTELVKIDSDYDTIRQNQVFKISVNSFLWRVNNEHRCKDLSLLSK